MKNFFTKLAYCSISTCSTSFHDRMSFMQRLKNFAFLQFHTAFIRTRWNGVYREDHIFRQPPYQEMDDLTKIAEKISILFLNGEEFVDFPRPLTPGIHYMGELETSNKKPDPLDPEWQAIADRKYKLKFFF